MRKTDMLLYKIDAKYNLDYQEGRAIHAKGLAVETCDRMNDPARRSWQKAGWHDADIEAGNRRYF